MIIGTVLVPVDIVTYIALLGAPSIIVACRNPAISKATSVFYELETKRITHEICVHHSFSGSIAYRVELHVRVDQFAIKVHGSKVGYMAGELANNMFMRPRASDGVRDIRLTRKGIYCMAKNKTVIAYVPLRTYMLRVLSDVARLIGILNTMERVDVAKVADGLIRIDDLLQTYGESDAALTRTYRCIEQLRCMFDD